MLKKILIFVLVAAMLSLTSCKVVEVIDHGKDPEETTAPQKEYEPWGYWYSAETLGAIEFVEGSNVAKLYLLTAGYYEYDLVEEVLYTYDGNAIFTVTYNDTTLKFTFDKYANTLMTSNVVYMHTDKAPNKHPVYSYPNYPDMDIDTYITVGEIDFASLSTPILEGTRFEIAKIFYGSENKIPANEGIERAAQSGDYVNVDYCGYLDGVAFDGGKAENVRLFISDYKNGYIPGFTDGIIGNKVGETFDVNVTFPENYGATELAGKAVVFTMTLNSIYNLSLTDKQVAEFEGNEFQTYEAWFKDMQQTVTKSLFYNALLAATTPSEATLPADVYLYYYQKTIDYWHSISYSNKINYEILLMYYLQTSEAAILQDSINEAVYHMGTYALAEKNELAWTQEEFDTEYERFVTEYLKENENASREEACKYADKYTAQIKDALTEEKVLNWAFDMIFPKESIQEGEIDFAALSYVAFGDSITKGADHNNNYEPMEYPYPRLVGESLKLKSVQNLASSGATFCANENGNVCMTDRITSYADEADIISVWLGFNDWARSFPLGSIEDKTNTTIYGCLNLIAEHLTTVHKNAFVFFMTPYKTSLIRNEDYTLPDVVTAIKKVSTIYDIPVLDMYNMGNFELEMYDEISDGVHPTPEFVKKYTAPQITKFIKENFPK